MAVLLVSYMAPGVAPGAAASPDLLRRSKAGFANGFPNGDRAIFNSELAASKAAGATWYRGDVVSLRHAAVVVPAVKAAGLKMLAILGGSNPTVDEETVRAVVSTYPSGEADGIDAVEILNEPNVVGRDTPTQYLALLKRIVPVIRSVDRHMPIVIGALAAHGTEFSSTSPYGYLAAMYRANHGHKLPGDAISYHGYSYPYAPNCSRLTCPANTFQQAPDIHALMAAHGDGGKKLWCTEAGTPTGVGPDAQTAAVQADWVTQYLSIWARFGSWTGPFFYHQVRDIGADRSNPEDNFGLLDENFRVKKTDDGQPSAYTRFRDGLR